jgi:hypothetical protein
MKTIKKIIGTVLTLVIGFFLGWVFTGDKEKFKGWLVKKITKLLYGEEREVKRSYRPYYYKPRYNYYGKLAHVSDPTLHKYQTHNQAENVLDILKRETHALGWVSKNDLCDYIEQYTDDIYDISQHDPTLGWTDLSELDTIQTYDGTWRIANWPKTVEEGSVFGY